MMPSSRSCTRPRPPLLARATLLALVFVMGTGCRACLPSDTDSIPAGARREPSTDAPLEPLCPGAPEACRMGGPVPELMQGPADAGPHADTTSACNPNLVLQRRADMDPNPSIGVLEREPGIDSPDARFMLVAHTTAGWFEATLPLGTGRTARQGSSYVRWLGADYGTYVSRRDGRVDVAFLAVYERGVSVPHGCSLETSAEVRVRLCALSDGAPFCVGELALAQVPYHADNLLPTVDEALGQCDAASGDTTSGSAESDVSSTRDVSLVTHDRLVVRQAHVRRVFELGALLCDLSGAPEFCPVASIGPGAAAGAAGIAPERIMAHSFK